MAFNFDKPQTPWVIIMMCNLEWLTKIWNNLREKKNLQFGKVTSVFKWRDQALPYNYNPTYLWSSSTLNSFTVFFPESHIYTKELIASSFISATYIYSFFCFFFQPGILSVYQVNQLQIVLAHLPTLIWTRPFVHISMTTTINSTIIPLEITINADPCSTSQLQFNLQRFSHV